MAQDMVSEGAGTGGKGTVNVRMSEQCQNEMSEEKPRIYAVCQNVRRKNATLYSLTKKFLMGMSNRKENI